MGSLFGLVGWCILFVLCWPLALLTLVVWPIVWVLLLPLRLIGIAVDAVFAFLRTVLFLPARLLGYREPGEKDTSA
ncbi:hypothetical protein AUP74_01498 [Microbulbifer aggregans]|uniref:Uncharacterized protein n=1 Tax=Microbulbifer aggregans TaxID=1769779 RepID=A0A1C9W714_9GAMM|nr:hypothetical protein [Microbulbifer aggregans]AOS96935.1 hypothetical protein AUP74_01498 [Microbulbifer aggregans]